MHTTTANGSFRTPQRPVSLAEAARLFKSLGLGPSRSTLSRDATSSRLDRCRDLNAGRVRPRYRFDDLCILYGVDAQSPKPALAAARAAGGNGTAPAGAVIHDLGPLRSEIQTLHVALGEMRAELEGAVRDLVEVRKRLQLKYDVENGLLRTRAETAEARWREAQSLEGLTREISALRQAVHGAARQATETAPG